LKSIFFHTTAKLGRVTALTCMVCGIALSTIPAHAGAVTRNYDADGNYTGYSERETEAETNARVMGEFYAASAKARMLDACLKQVPINMHCF
jgi:hypothetical protein